MNIFKLNRTRVLLLVVGLWGLASVLTQGDFLIIEKWYSLFTSFMFVLSGVLGFFTFSGNASLSKGEICVCFLVLIASFIQLIIVGSSFDSNQHSLKVVLVPLSLLLISLAALVIEKMAITSEKKNINLPK